MSPSKRKKPVAKPSTKAKATTKRSAPKRVPAGRPAKRTAAKSAPAAPAGAYAGSGVDHGRKDRGLDGMIAHLRGTYANNPRAAVADGVGGYASVVELLDQPLGIAISTDSVGTKVLVAQMAGRHDTVGIDCVAMNANDVACVGANPLAMVDYVGVNVVDADVMEALARGLAEGARRAEISIPGGEIAQVRDLVRGLGDVHYDLIGTCVGVVEPARALDGRSLAPGDTIVGLASTGVHSNGFSLIRRIVFETLGKRIGDRLPECGRTVADELLEPTALYVKECKTLLRLGVPVRAFFNVTGGGFTNLLRFRAEGCGILLDHLPEPPPIFRLLRDAGGVTDAEMHQVFNMGVGFAVAVPEGWEDEVVRVARAQGKKAWSIGRVVEDPLRRLGIVGSKLRGALVASKSKGAILHAERLPEDFGA